MAPRYIYAPPFTTYHHRHNTRSTLHVYPYLPSVVTMSAAAVLSKMMAMAAALFALFANTANANPCAKINT